MKFKLRLMIIGVAVFYLLLACVASAASCYKRLYIDGVFIDDSNAAAGLGFSFERLTIGAGGNRWYLYNEYIGKMDEFAIYAGVLSDPCIAAHFTVKDSNAAYTAAVSHDNPLLWLRFEDAVTDDNDPAINSGWIGIDGNYVTTGGSALTQTTGINADSQCIVFPDTIVDSPGHCVDVWDGNGDFGEDWDGDVTIELWVNFTDVNKAGEPENDYPRFFQHNGDYQLTESYGVVVQGPNTLGIMGGGEVASMDLSFDINDGQWHHVVVTYDSAYEINDINTLTYAEEVAADNPVLWLRLNDDIPEDSSVADSNLWVGYGSGTKLRVKAGGIGGGSRYLEGTTASYVAATNSSDPPPNEGDPNWYGVFGDQYAFAPDDITFELWYRVPPDKTQDDYAYFFQQVGPWDWPPGSENGSDRAPAVGKNENDTIRVMGGSTTWYTNRPVMFDGDWHQLVVTYDEQYQGDPNSMHAQLYQDGVFRGENTFTGPDARLGPELSHVMVGARNDLGYTYNALIAHVDEFAIYEGILDPNRIAAHYSAWQPKTCAELLERWNAEPADLDGNCVINFFDFAIFAQEWAQCNDPEGGEGCSPNW